MNDGENCFNAMMTLRAPKSVHIQGRFVKHTGDGLLATFDGPTRAVLCATALAERMPQIGLDIRSGLHTGECLRRGDDIGGIAVHIAARIAAKAGAKEVLVSNTVKDLVYGSGITFEDRGAHVLKGVPGEWQVHAPTGLSRPSRAGARCRRHAVAVPVAGHQFPVDERQRHLRLCRQQRRERADAAHWRRSHRPRRAMSRR